YISEPRSEKETDHLFAEPGLFVVNSKGQVQLVDISNGPFARPDLEVLLSGLAFIRNPENDYPIRGTYQAAI
ncbi:thioredoxin peroxidase, partial [Vibrio parahaemolyticus]|nr:thioredoxin peroxidase [Vibrio parahaemolyticus]